MNRILNQKLFIQFKMKWKSKPENLQPVFHGWKSESENLCIVSNEWKNMDVNNRLLYSLVFDDDDIEIVLKLAIKKQIDITKNSKGKANWNDNIY